MPNAALAMLLALCAGLTACPQSSSPPAASTAPTSSSTPAPPSSASPPAAATGKAGWQPPAGLVGTRWRLIDLDGEALPADAGAWIMIEADTIGGSSGCNTFGLRYAPPPPETRGQTSNVGDLEATEIGCQEPRGGREARMFEALRGSARMRRQGEQLQVLDAAGRVTLTFVACARCGPTQSP